MKKDSSKPASSKNTLSNDLKTEPPISEKDEVKNAEKKMSKSVGKTSKKA